MGNFKAWVRSKFKLQNAAGTVINPSTEEKQDTLIGHVDGVETKLDTIISQTDAVESNLVSINSNTDGIETKLDTLITQTDSVESSLADIAADKQPHSRDTNNEQTTPLTNGAPVAFTVDEPANTIESVGHGIVAGKVVHLTTTGTLPAPLAVGTSYYVVNPTADDFQVSLTRGGAAINITDTGTGTHSYSVAGEFTGVYTKVDDIERFEILYAATTPLALVEKVWSNDGINPLGGDLGTSALTTRAVSGYNVVYDVNEGRNIAPYYKIHVINGATNQSAYPSLIHITWLIKMPYNGAFVFLDAALTNLSKALLSRSVLAGTLPDGTFGNAGITALSELRVRDEAVIATHSGSAFVEGIRDDISINFSSGTHIGELDGIENDGSVNGTASFNATHGRVDFAVPATAASTAIFRSVKAAVYEPGHTIRGEQTIQISAQPTGNGFVEWGFGDGSNTIGWRYDSTGIRAIRRKNGTLEEDVAQADWNRDTCTAQEGSLFRSGGTGQTLSPLMNNLYGNTFEWLGADPPEWIIKSPSSEFIVAHVEEFANNNTGTTLPSPALPLFIHIANDTTSGQAITVSCGSWRGGVHTNKAVLTGRQPDGDFEDVRVSGSDPRNTTTTPLTAGSTYTGTAFDATGFVSVAVIVQSNVVSATDGLVIQFSNDSFTTVTKEHKFTYGTSDIGKGRLYSVPANQGEEYRVKYTNGGTNQTTFDLRTELCTSIIQPMTDDIGRGTLLVTPGLRISQVFKRTPVTATGEGITADTNIRTTTSGRKFFCIGYAWALSNSSTASPARIIIRDGIGGQLRIPIMCQEGAIGADFAATGSGTFPDEGLPFTTGVYADVVAGTPILDIVLHGYEEDV